MSQGSSSTPPFGRVLIANRGEIAVRVIRACRELGIGTVAVYSDADREALHVRMADEAIRIGPATPSESYLAVDRIVAAAVRAGADAVHPGYGFLAESAALPRALAAAGIVWIGPSPAAIEAMGSKIGARQTMAAAGVPVVPGTTERIASAERVVELGDELGWPLALKASAGGGGRGMRIVRTAAEAASSLAAAEREGRSWFGDDAVYVERYLADPRHVEVQLLADSHGTVIHLGERDCTLQRRHQKIIEESPSPAVDAELRERLGAMAVAAARAVDYVGAGTIECLMDRSGEVFFLEMNTRVQVEHTITEAVTGIDIVREQILVAAGAPLSIAQSDVVLRGHAIECRINAEDPARGYLPSPGVVTRYRPPSGPGIRVDSGIEPGDRVEEAYDPMIAKLVVWDRDRATAVARMGRALAEFEIEGVATLLPLHRVILGSPEFGRGETCAGLVEGAWPEGLASQDPTGALLPSTSRHEVQVEVDGRLFDVAVVASEPPGYVRDRDRRARRAAAGAAGSADGVVAAPMQGSVASVGVDVGDAVESGAVLVVIEAMKMENEVRAPVAGFVSEVRVAVGAGVRKGEPLLVVSAVPEPTEEATR